MRRQQFVSASRRSWRRFLLRLDTNESSLCLVAASLRWRRALKTATQKWLCLIGVADASATSRVGTFADVPANSPRGKSCFAERRRRRRARHSIKARDLLSDQVSQGQRHTFMNYVARNYRRRAGRFGSLVVSLNSVRVLSGRRP